MSFSYSSDRHVLDMCNKFSRFTLSTAEPEVETLCSAAIRNAFMPLGDRRKLETALTRIYNFMSSLDSTLDPSKPRRPAPVNPVLPPEPKYKRTPKTVQLTPQERHEAEMLRRDITRLKRDHTKTYNEITALRDEWRRKAKEVAAQRKLVDDRVEKPRIAFGKAIDGLDGLTDLQLHEIRAYVTPPPTVTLVMKVVLALLGDNKPGEWESVQGYLHRRDFIPLVRGLNPYNIMPARREDVKRTLAANPALTVEAAGKASRAAAPLLAWVKSMVAFADAIDAAEPLEEQLARLNAEATALQLRLEEREASDGITREIGTLEREYDFKFSDEAMKRRLHDMRAADEAHNKVLRDKYDSACFEARQKADLANERTLPPVILSDKGREIVDGLRDRCNTIIRAAVATMDALDLPHPCPLVVQRGRLVDSARNGDAGRRGRSGTPTRSIRSTTPTSQRSGRQTIVRTQSPTVQRLLDQHYRRERPRAWFDPDHRGVASMDAEDAAGARIVMVGSSAAKYRTEADGCVQYDSLAVSNRQRELRQQQLEQQEQEERQRLQQSGGEVNIPPEHLVLDSFN